MTIYIQHYEDFIVIRMRAEEDDKVAHLEVELRPGDFFMDMEYEEVRALGEGEIEMEEGDTK